MDLVRDVGLEIRDIRPEAEDLLLAFLEEPTEFSEEYLSKILSGLGLSADAAAAAKELLLWFGVLGIRRGDTGVTYIYNCNYEMPILKAILRKASASGGAILVVNPAFHEALELRTK